MQLIIVIRKEVHDEATAKAVLNVIKEKHSNDPNITITAQISAQLETESKT